MSSPPPSMSIGNPVDTAWDFRLTRAIWMGSYTLLLYDYALTLSDEVAYMWIGPWTRARILFLLVRITVYFGGLMIYSMLPDKILDNFEPAVDLLSLTIRLYGCNFSYTWFVFSEVFTQVTGSIILILRVYAIYDCNKKLLKALFGLLASVLIIQIVFSAFLSTKSGFKLNPSLHTSGCIPTHWVYKPWVYWVPATSFDGILFALVVARSIRRAMEQDTPDLFFKMFRDSSIYFGFVFLVIIADLIVWTVGNQGLYVALPELVPILHSIMACRMLLNINNISRPWLAEPWRDQDTAVFSVALRPLSFLKSSSPVQPNSQSDSAESA
ncbi:hypothetical protein BDW22DRAFT_1431336 [Trametopsis cervina]|nr:hypothetical protein BDW22DRAFT_1431336 [Trametopsis cervina]